MFCAPLDEFLENADVSLDFVKAALVRQQALHPELTGGECLRNRTYLRSLVSADFPEFLDRAAEAVESGAEALEELRPELHRVMTERRKRILQEEVRHCFRFEVDALGRCYFHIRNPRMPDSFLDDKAFVISEFRRIMDEAESAFHCRELFTATWMNSQDRFLSFFPDEWIGNRKTLPADNVGPTLGWQGQFINRRGMLNRRLAEHYITHGVLRYPRAESHCSFAAMRAHLDKLAE